MSHLEQYLTHKKHLVYVGDHQLANWIGIHLGKAEVIVLLGMFAEDNLAVT